MKTQEHKLQETFDSLTKSIDEEVEKRNIIDIVHEKRNNLIRQEEEFIVKHLIAHKVWSDVLEFLPLDKSEVYVLGHFRGPLKVSFYKTNEKDYMFLCKSPFNNNTYCDGTKEITHWRYI